VWIEIDRHTAPGGGAVRVYRSEPGGVPAGVRALYVSPSRWSFGDAGRLAWWPAVEKTIALWPSSEEEAAEMLLLADDPAALEAYVRAVVRTIRPWWAQHPYAPRPPAPITTLGGDS